MRWNTTFRAFADFWGFEQLGEWTATVADVRVHGTTHERPVDRFARERDALVPAPAGRVFRLEAPLTRVVATDYLVSVDTNRYSVPFTLIGQPVEVHRRDGHLEMRHRGQVVATHPVLGGRHQLRILPEHGPGPIQAFAPPMESFRRGRDFAAWLGLVPRQSSTGGKSKLGKISKMGQRDLRRLLVTGAMATVSWGGAAWGHEGPVAGPDAGAQAAHARRGGAGQPAWRPPPWR